ncbi:MAG: AAA family ATPase [Cyanobacteria bacterium P01_A01_bin.137]
MPIYRSNRPHRVLSNQEKLDLFRDCTVVHPHLKRAYEEFRDAVNNPGGASVIFLFGPTGVGKTTLLRQIMKVMMSEKTARLEKDPNFLPVATTEARAPESGSFDWKVYYQSVLASLSELPASEYSIPNRSKLKKSKSYQRNVGSKNSHLSTLREQVIVNMRHRELVVFLTDEAQRFSKLASSSRQQVQMDALQSMASMTNTLHGLFGTYELLEFRNLSGQLSRRSIDIHFPRYQADCSEDLIEFQRVLKSFGEKMTLEKAPELEIHWEYFYERSIGCVGILKDWLTQAYRKALDESASTLREHHWQSYAPSVAKCLQIAAEAIEGEKAFQFESGEMSLLRQKLGLSKASSSGVSSDTLSVVASSKKTKGRPGVRQPNRDVIGEP